MQCEGNGGGGAGGDHRVVVWKAIEGRRLALLNTVAVAMIGSMKEGPRGNGGNEAEGERANGDEL